ncbi:hypothetical protein [Kitasatospora purpeofusca]|uniref:TolB family protein n=1 Tax=Kitasatospora purpeofusca TaxID=67352 RepID=UPI002A59AEA0|nr:hypothetical protein [Kitasatospora purpeofusca]MDY0814123.1 hypothetical protein [Kitasatospora purpeofusca]
MADRSAEFRPGTIGPRPVRRAAFSALVRSPEGASTLLVSDADTGELVGVAGLPGRPEAVPLALSWDGAHLLFRTGPEDRPDRDLVLLRLATGERRVFDADVDGLVEQAALSPDGRSMATLADEDGVRVDVTDLETGTREPLWSADGWRSDSGVAWSPDGTLLAVGLVDEEEDRTDTVVLSLADGSVLARYEGLAALGSPNGAWTGERELLLVEEFSDESVPPLFLHDVATGGVRRFDRVPGQVGGVSAVAAERLVQRLPGGLFVGALDGTDSRSVLGLPSTYEVGFFDVSEVF